jgi:hypothetical protein
MKRQTAADLKKEQEVARILEKWAKCQIIKFGEHDPIDRYAIRDKFVVCLLEIKCRDHALGEFPTTWMSARKWMALAMGAMGFGVPAYWVVRFTDKIGYVNVFEVEGSKPFMAGRRDRNPPEEHDIEPMIDVPIEKLHVFWGPLPQAEEAKTQTSGE